MVYECKHNDSPPPMKPHKSMQADFYRPITHEVMGELPDWVVGAATEQAIVWTETAGGQGDGPSPLSETDSRRNTKEARQRCIQANVVQQWQVAAGTLRK